jgi:hypothetical protein
MPVATSVVAVAATGCTDTGGHLSRRPAMLDVLQHHLDRIGARQRTWLTWAATGATVQACVPALHGAWTALGPLALWLWLLPLAALALELVAAPPHRVDAGAGSRRRSRARPASRPALSRRERVRVPPRAVARPVRRAG